jgi:hypothetical protein
VNAALWFLAGTCAGIAVALHPMTRPTPRDRPNVMAFVVIALVCAAVAWWR